MMQKQDAKMETIRAEIERLPATKESVRGIVTEMVAEIAKVIESDFPFRIR